MIKIKQKHTLINFKKKSIALFFTMLFVISIFSPMATSMAQEQTRTIANIGETVNPSFENSNQNIGLSVNTNQGSLGESSANTNKPKIAIFLHRAQLGGKAAFELVPENDRPVSLSFYYTLNASDYVNESLDLTDYEVIIVKTAGMRGRELQVEALLPILEPARNAGAEIISMRAEHGIATINLSKHLDIVTYFNNLVWFDTIPQSTNALNLMNYIYVNFMRGNAEVQPPRIRPEPGIYHPNAYEHGFVFDNIEDYMTWAKNRIDKPFNENNITIGLIACAHFTSGYVMDEFIKQIEATGANVIMTYPITGVMGGRENPVTDMFYNEGESRVDAIISFQSFLKSVPDNMRIQQFKKLNVPVFGAVSLGGMIGSATEEEWRECPRGISLNHVGFFISPLEMIGVAAPTVISAKSVTKYGDTVDIALPNQIARLVNRAINHAKLSHNQNQDKKIALIHFEYAASGLNTPASIEQLLKSLNEHGYTVDMLSEDELIDTMYSHGRNIGMWAQPMLESMVKNHSNEIVLIPVSTYKTWFNEMIPEYRQQEVIDFWGKPEDGSMVVNYNGKPHFVLPRVNAGNIMIMPQPSRGGGNVSDAVMHHDLATPPHHQYIAFHLWLQTEEVDAIIHFGTHGSQEWLPGKERGLDDFSCWPSLMSGELPIIYPYIVDNVAEAIQAKRRGDAVIISHMTPQMAAAGLYGELRILHDDIHSYRRIPDQTVREVELRMIIERAINMSVDLEMKMPGFEGIPWDSNLTEKIHMHIHDVEGQIIPVGLHILGKIPNQTLLYESVLKIIGPEFTDEIIKVGGITHEYVCCCQVNQNGDEHACYIEEVAKHKAKKMLRMTIANDTPFIDIQQKVLGDSSDKLSQHLEDGAKHLENFLRVDNEIKSILNALSGGFVAPSTGGDPIRNPESLPTGRNLYSFDPRTIPTRAAWEVGVNTLNTLLEDHYIQNGTYPDKIGFVLFAGETMRQNGVAEAQILYAMGVRPIWDNRGRIRVDGGRNGLEIIPDNELGRPRIDIMTTITCLYRDVFSCRVEVIDAAVELVINHKGDSTIPNHVRDNYKNLTKELKEMGYDSETASNLSSARIFGPPPGGYGMGLSGAVLAGGTWDERSKLANSFLNRMGNIYSRELWGEPNRMVLERALSGTDIAIFSRSSNQYGAITTDHPFESLGGLGMAVEYVDGTQPTLRITDLRNPHKDGEIVTLNQFLRMELRARQYNPRFIRGLMEHGWAGASELENTISNLYGWQVVSPDIVTDDMWNEIYEIYIQDKLNLNLGEFFDEYNPLARQEIMRRLVESYERGFWDADSEIINDLVEQIVESVAENGLTCCASCCANPRMDQFIAERIQSGELEIDEETLKKFSARGQKVLERDLVGVDVGEGEPATDPATDAANADLVEGQIMEPVEPMQPTTGVDLPVTEIVIGILIIGLIGAVYLLTKKKD